MYTWGRGQFGRLGMGVFQDELAPTLVEIVPLEMEDEIRGDNTRKEVSDFAERSRITQLAAGAYHSLALAGDGTVWSWGFNACILHFTFSSLQSSFKLHFPEKWIEML